MSSNTMKVVDGVEQIAKELGFTDKTTNGKGQGMTVNFWRNEIESISIDCHIDEPSIYLDIDHDEKETLEAFKQKMDERFKDKYHFIGKGKIVYEFNFMKGVAS